MRIYIKSDFKKKITFTTRELLWKMWFKEWNGHLITTSNVGDDEMLRGDFFFGVQFDKWRFNDKRWNHIPYDKSDPWNSFSDENIQLEFENDFITDGRERGENLRIATTHTDILMVDKRAMYIMAVEVASAIDGQISEDNKHTWMDVEIFKELHKDVLSLTYDQATDISVEELKSMKPIEDPLWDEEERLHEEYIKIHGERVYDDEEED
ncbi:hypothetical protein MK500_06525 [Streptococcus gordonii]|mgnify:FL=1|uniref:hypothetical protein n=1 Tax=Streptococcus gordonii TaxID=1302 RepID=UPI000F66B51F|nr:hypothetical protein [Streptococcus gordonii]MBW7663786.1 hypothetical protein [Streptococcus gordonii]MCY7139248.1 hypothetical protein [Streptococcus gordonii]RSJ61382.1 hypothetical protein D8807_07755 [Streptococcus gordonii]RSK03262.1 hypothetical protein D8809_04685 [Streptococcus gordonii]